MANPVAKGQGDRFAEVMAALAEEPGVSFGKPGKAFGSSALKVNDKIFAMVSSAGQFVVELPKARSMDSTSTAAGVRFEASKGRPCRSGWPCTPSRRRNGFILRGRRSTS